MNTEHIVILLLVIYIIYVSLPREGFTTADVRRAVKISAQSGEGYDRFVAELGTNRVKRGPYQSLTSAYLKGNLNNAAITKILAVK